MSKQTDRDYYEILGVARDADVKTIKRAFLKAARTVHPDVSDAPDAEMRFKEVNEAYSVLSDERRRANYDTYGDPDGPAGFGGSNYVDMSDIFGGFNMSDIQGVPKLCTERLIVNNSPSFMSFAELEVPFCRARFNLDLQYGAKYQSLFITVGLR